jgi:hypothetical protein
MLLASDKPIGSQIALQLGRKSTKSHTRLALLDHNVSCKDTYHHQGTMWPVWTFHLLYESSTLGRILPLSIGYEGINYS